MTHSKKFNALCARTFDKAADAINKYGFIQGKRGSPEEGFCTLGAISYVAPRLHRKRDLIIKEFSQFIGSPTIVGWNDERGRTKTQVIRKLRSAAKNFRSSKPNDEKTYTK